MVDVGLFHFRLGFFADRLQVHRREAWETDVVGVIRCHGIDAQGHEVVGAALEILHRLFRKSDVLEQEVAIAGALQVGGFVFGGLACQVVRGGAVHRDQCFTVGLWQWEVVDEVFNAAGVQLIRGDIVGHHRGWVAGHQFVFAEVFLVEEHRA